MSTLTTLTDERERALEKIARLKAKANKASAEAYQVERRIQQIDHAIAQQRYPEEPVGEHPLVRFEKMYRGQTTRYVYAAVKGGGRWFLTGGSQRTPQNLTWLQLCDFVRLNNVLLEQLPEHLYRRAEIAELEPPF